VASVLRIRIIGIYYTPELTGIGPYTAAVAEHFADRGHIVRVVTGYPHFPSWRAMPLPPNDRLANPRVSRYAHFIPRKPSGRSRALYEASWFVSALRALAGEKDDDVVIGVSPALSGAILAWRAARRSGARLGLIFQDLTAPAVHQSGYPGGVAIANVAERLEAFAARQAHGTAIIAESFRPYLEKIGAHAIYRVFNWTRALPITESIEATRLRLGWGPNEFICLYAGNMGHKQGLDNLLDAGALLDGRGIRIVLAGDGNDRRRLEARCGDMGRQVISFLDLQPAEQHGAMLRAADILLLSQRASVTDMALPSKLTSYFAVGRPVVGAVAEGSTAAMEMANAKAGIVVRPGDTAALANAILALRENVETCRVLGDNGRAYAIKCLTPEKGLATYDEFLARLISR
jgi:colanic acid biosynthesis glycosyl transferase WcaI